jgi:hypothetical protein
VTRNATCLLPCILTFSSPVLYRISMACLLSEELWLLVFEQALGSCELFDTEPEPFALPGRKAILPLLLVCKQWQVREVQSFFINRELRRL